MSPVYIIHVIVLNCVNYKLTRSARPDRNKITLTACLIMLLNFVVLNLCSDLSSQPELQNVVLDCFSSSNEEVKSAASYALGMITRFFV